jgi:hypothetical protein
LSSLTVTLDRSVLGLTCSMIAKSSPYTESSCTGT